MHVLDTSVQFFQYAPGGELFDYIVAKDKLRVGCKINVIY